MELVDVKAYLHFFMSKIKSNIYTAKLYCDTG